MQVLLLLAALAAVAAGCGSARRREPIRGPMTLEAREQRGQVVFMRQCHHCHPAGEAGLGPSLNNKPRPDFLKRFQVRHGLGAMPAFAEERVDDEQLDDLMAYLSALRGHPRGQGGRVRTTP
jgi:mono/diheme cytochrome c family protein